MPSRISNVALTVHRDGVRINVKAGQKFNFTKDEIEDFSALNPEALRLPINESAGDALEEEILPISTSQKDSVDLADMTVSQLRGFAKANSLEVDLTLNKAQLLEAVTAAIQEAL